jgi:hypothetical protein
MRLYLAGPMRGKPDLNFPAFRAAAAKLREAGHFVFDPSESLPGDASIRECMATDLSWIALHAEGIALLPGWDHSRGAKAELALAHAIGLHVMLVSDEGRIVHHDTPKGWIDTSMRDV